ncbi:uncharacterized protein LOC105024617 isoform X2 [Esox lucius]|uniref:uncharacterized protein LOC105024617 isoform X2 n=1 Tax=Esox lucius TaxID=8010 RepID=UPI0005767B47|nr:uncharacterized protein LOC105024617 isoform X2 [Esox lucius]
MTLTVFSPTSMDTCGGSALTTACRSENQVGDIYSAVRGMNPVPSEGPSGHSSTPPASGPHGLRKHFLSKKLDCDHRPSDPDRLFQKCFVANVTAVDMEGPS